MSYALLAEGWGGEAYLVADVIKDRYHAAHVGGGEDWVEKLALLAVVIAWNNNIEKSNGSSMSGRRPNTDRGFRVVRDRN